MASSHRPEPFVRPFKPRDVDSMIIIFRETADAVLRNAGDPALHIASYIWCRPYFTLSPSTCFVLDDGNGTAVGYIIGTPDTKAFVHDYEDQYIPQLQSQGLAKPDLTVPCSWDDDLPGALEQILYSPASSLLHTDVPTLLASYPAHLHIDLLPLFQHQGYGPKLMDHFCTRLVECGATGVHLIMSGENRLAGKFYAAVGFGRIGEVLDGGVSGEEGRDKNRSIWLVRSL